MAEKNKLPGSLTLRNRVEIGRLFKSGRRLSGDSFTLLWERSDSFRFGIFVKKEHGSTVTRNRIKRLFREAIRLHRTELNRPLIIGVLPKTTIKEWDFGSIDAEIGRVFNLLNTRAK